MRTAFRPTKTFARSLLFAASGVVISLTMPSMATAQSEASSQSKESASARIDTARTESGKRLNDALERSELVNGPELDGYTGEIQELSEIERRIRILERRKREAEILNELTATLDEMEGKDVSEGDGPGSARVIQPSRPSDRLSEDGSDRSSQPQISAPARSQEDMTQSEMERPSDRYQERQDQQEDEDERQEDQQADEGRDLPVIASISGMGKNLTAELVAGRYGVFRVKPGDVIRKGLVVEAITPDDVILNAGGRMVSLKGVAVDQGLSRLQEKAQEASGKASASSSGGEWWNSQEDPFAPSAGDSGAPPENMPLFDLKTGQRID